MAASEVEELVSFLHSDKAALRKGACDAVLGLTASAEGRETLHGTRVAEHLRRLIGDLPVIASVAVTALVNLSADARMMDQMLRAGMVGALMESLRDDDCKHKRVIVMLLSNLSQTPEGCDQILQKGDGGGALMGLHLRRLIQWFVAGGRPGTAGGAEDTFEYIANVLQNVTQVHEARRILLDPERGILPALLPQLRSSSVTRRRGVAGTIRNCCLEAEPHVVRYMLSPAVDVVTAVLLPLAGPDTYTADERAAMNPKLYSGGPQKQRELDPLVRRLCVEALLLLAGSRPGREHLRSCRAYPVVRTFHEWLESVGRHPAPEHDGDIPPVDRMSETEESPMHADDEVTVAAINSLVQQLFRDDEVKHTSEVTGKFAPGTDAADGLIGPAGGLDAFHDVSRATRAGAAGAAGAASAPPRATLLPEAEAKRIAAQVSSGAVHSIADAELETLVTPVPDWTMDSDDEHTAGAAAKSAAVGAAKRDTNSTSLVGVD